MGKVWKIRLRSIPEIRQFCMLADACDFDINIGYDRVHIDGKSLIGVMGLDLGRVLTVSYDGECKPFEEYLMTKGERQE